MSSYNITRFAKPWKVSRFDKVFTFLQIKWTMISSDSFICQAELVHDSRIMTVTHCPFLVFFRDEIIFISLLLHCFLFRKMRLSGEHSKSQINKKKSPKKNHKTLSSRRCERIWMVKPGVFYCKIVQIFQKKGSQVGSIITT